MKHPTPTPMTSPGVSAALGCVAASLCTCIPGSTEERQGLGVPLSVVGTCPGYAGIRSAELVTLTTSPCSVCLLADPGAWLCPSPVPSPTPAPGLGQSQSWSQQVQFRPKPSELQAKPRRSLRPMIRAWLRVRSRNSPFLY